jgi:enamine deaminase RidA (YjgF/YER057c/UK114 family)
MKKEIPLEFQNPSLGEPKVVQIGSQFCIYDVFPKFKESTLISNLPKDQAYQAFERALSTLKKCELSLDDVARVAVIVKNEEAGDAARNIFQFFFRGIEIKPPVLIFLSGEKFLFGSSVKLEIDAYKN